MMSRTDRIAAKNAKADAKYRAAGGQLVTVDGIEWRTDRAETEYNLVAVDAVEFVAKWRAANPADDKQIAGRLDGATEFLATTDLAVKAPMVHKAEDGSFYICDGRHRSMACEARGGRMMVQVPAVDAHAFLAWAR